MFTLSRTLLAISPPTSAITKLCGLNVVPSVSSRLWTIITTKPMEKKTAVIKPSRNSCFSLATEGDMMRRHPLQNVKTGVRALERDIHGRLDLRTLQRFEELFQEHLARVRWRVILALRLQSFSGQFPPLLPRLHLK